jgi:hypothetical protein
MQSLIVATAAALCLKPDGFLSSGQAAGDARGSGTIFHGAVACRRSYLLGGKERHKAMMNGYDGMMEGMGMMMWGMGLVWVLLALVLILAAAALARYVFFGGHKG